MDLFRTRVIEGRLSKVEFKYLENSLVNSPLYNTYKESIKLREAKNYEQSDVALHKELFLTLNSQ